MPQTPKLIPAAMFIEMAVDVIKQADDLEIERQIHELNVANAERSSVMPEFEAFERGYIVGLYTARAVLATNAKAITAGVMF